MSAFDFITDDALRKTLDDSVEYMFALREQSSLVEKNPLYQEETRRVIILYVISVIEAVLLHFYRLRGEKMEKIEYTHIQQLTPEYSHSEKSSSPVVVAVQETVVRREDEIGLHTLVKFYEKKGLLPLRIVKDILEFNSLRNTFHFSKVGDRACDVDRVEKALELLVYVIENAPKDLVAK